MLTAFLGVALAQPNVVASDGFIQNEDRGAPSTRRFREEGDARIEVSQELRQQIRQADLSLCNRRRFGPGQISTASFIRLSEPVLDLDTTSCIHALAGISPSVR